MSTLIRALLLCTIVSFAHSLPTIDYTELEIDAIIKDYDRFQSLNTFDFDNDVFLKWHAPFLSGGGYSSEALAYLESLVMVSQIPAIAQHGDSISEFAVQHMPAETKRLVKSSGWMQNWEGKLFVSVCHSEPGAWHMPPFFHMLYSTSLCPDPKSDYKIGRTMFETDRIPKGWADRLNAMDEVWVPTKWSKDVFAAQGVNPAKLVIVPETVNINRFTNRWINSTLNGLGNSFIPRRQCQCEGSSKIFCDDKEVQSSAEEPLAVPACAHRIGNPSCPFRFLFVGKWEHRKGLDVLLRAFAVASVTDSDVNQGTNDNRNSPRTESLGRNHVELHILLAPYHSTTEFIDEIRRFIEKEGDCDTRQKECAGSSCANTCLSSDQMSFLFQALHKSDPFSNGDSYYKNNHKFTLSINVFSNVPEPELPSIYSSVDILVQPSRGEGWGRPHMEALSSGIPVIATNWSGPTAFLTSHNGYPLGYEEHLVPVGVGAFADHLHAAPSEQHLIEIIDNVIRNPVEVKCKGLQGRRDILSNYPPERIGKFLKAQMYRIQRKLVNNGEYDHAMKAEL